MRKDIYHHKERYLAWKEDIKNTGIEGITKTNSNLILNYIFDMEEGKNVARGTKKGSRSYQRLNTIKDRMIPLTKHLERKGLKNLSKANADIVVKFFNHELRNGIITRGDGKPYKSVSDQAKQFIAYWNWFRKVNRKEGKIIPNITEDIDTSQPENKFVYFTFEQLKEMLPYFTEDEQVRMLFKFDTIIRSPTELMNVKLSDLTPDFNELTIREETSKTYGRTIKLLLCKEELKKYIVRNKLKDDDFLFIFSAPLFNKKLKKVAKTLFNNQISKGGKKYSELTMYDFRHAGACHWRKGAYRTKIDALMYRGAWSNLRILNYYTKKIGMKDSIERDDLLIGVDKHELELKNEKLQNKLEYLKEEIKDIKSYLYNHAEKTMPTPEEGYTGVVLYKKRSGL